MTNTQKERLRHALGIVSGRVKPEYYDYKLLEIDDKKLVNKEYSAKEKAEDIVYNSIISLDIFIEEN